MKLDNVGLSTESQGLLTALVALQQANGIDFDTAVARVRATAESGPLLVANIGWAELVDMLRWIAVPPTATAPPMGPSS